MNTSVEIAGVSFKNPVMTASGTFGSGMEYAEFADLNRLGAVITKGVANVPWPGNPTPRVAETYGGMLNAIGLQGWQADGPQRAKYFSGQIDDVLMYGRALSPSEILDLCNSQKPAGASCG